MKQTTLCHIEKDGKYLMLHRVKKENDMNKDKWIGVGGKFLEEETPVECLLREVYEETGLTLNSYQYRGIVIFESDIYENEAMHIFTSDDFSGNIKECDEGNLEWIDKQDLYSLPLWEGDKLFLKIIEKPSDFFNMTVTYQGDTLISATLEGKEIFKKGAHYGVYSKGQ